MANYEAITRIEKSIPIVEKMGVKVVDFKSNYTKLKLPFENNVNHIGVIYAGSLFTLGELAGGAIFQACFDNTIFFPIVKNVSIRFRRMATTDVTVEVVMQPEEVAQIEKETLEKGKSNFDLNLEIKDEQGEVCSTLNGTWQIRKI